MRFVVAESFRGLRSAEAEVVTGWGGGDCGYEFVKGETYLVYAFRGEKDKLLRTGICTRPRPSPTAKRHSAITGCEDWEGERRAERAKRPTHFWRRFFSSNTLTARLFSTMLLLSL